MNEVTKHPFFIIVTGLSGSGKSTALKAIEDAGFFCMDNIPIDLITKLIEIYDFASLNISRLCIGVDVRAGALSFVEKAPWTFSLLRETIGVFRLIFLEAAKEDLLNRFKETRRRHPLCDTYSNLIEAIEAETDLMAPIREMADFIIDTSNLNVHQLGSKINDIISREVKARDMNIEVRSFGFKKGIPLDADIVMDVRFLPNPHFVENLRDKTGRDEQVKDFLRSSESYVQFTDKFKDLIKLVLPMCKKEGRSYLNIAIGCTGGRHRSVAVAEEIQGIIDEAGYHSKLIHRDLS
ncbi:MAG: RNase adapter RapZ [Deltaproteobacteria bacterium]|nr:RNase adapter RapZ [Deltaproteobacteria bacterium]